MRPLPKREVGDPEKIQVEGQPEQQNRTPQQVPASEKVHSYSDYLKLMKERGA